MDKVCSNCGVIKPPSEYQKRSLSKDGLTSSCKVCLKERDARRFKNDPRVRERHKKYQATPEGKASMGKARKKWLDTNPEKRAAHVILNNRIRDGHIEKPDTCQECGDGGRIHGHHEDYSKPLEIDWLCATCHAKRHN